MITTLASFSGPGRELFAHHDSVAAADAAVVGTCRWLSARPLGAVLSRVAAWLTVWRPHPCPQRMRRQRRQVGMRVAMWVMLVTLQLRALVLEQLMATARVVLPRLWMSRCSCKRASQLTWTTWTTWMIWMGCRIRSTHAGCKQHDAVAGHMCVCPCVNCLLDDTCT